MDLMLQMGSGVLSVFGVCQSVPIIWHSSSMGTGLYTYLEAPHFLVPEVGFVRAVLPLLESSVLASFPWSPGLWVGWPVLTRVAAFS